jgi:hypothetical protein
MNFQFYVEKLEELKDYKEFTKKDKEAYPCSCFFVIDKEGKDNKTHFDFYTSEEKFVSFQLEEKKLVPVDIPEDKEAKKPDKISFDLEFDFNEIEEMVQDRMNKENIKNKIQKFLFSLQRLDGKHFLTGTVFISLLGMIKVAVDLESMSITDFEKKSFLDIIKPKKKD